MRSRTRIRHFAVVTLSATLLLGACDNSDADISSLDLTSPEEHTAVNTSQTPTEPEKPHLTSIPRVEEDRTTDRYLPPNAVLPGSGSANTPPVAPTTSNPDNGDEINSEDDGFPTAIPTEIPTESSAPIEGPESSQPSAESSNPFIPSLPPLTLPDRGAAFPSGSSSSTENSAESTSSPEAPRASGATEQTPSAEPEEDDIDSNVESAPRRSWVPVEPTEKG